MVLEARLTTAVHSTMCVLDDEAFDDEDGMPAKDDSVDAAASAVAVTTLALAAVPAAIAVMEAAARRALPVRNPARACI